MAFFFSIIVNSQLWKSQVSLGHFQSNYFWTLNCSRWTNNGWTSLPSYNQTPILHSGKSRMWKISSWPTTVCFKLITQFQGNLSLNNTGLHNKIKVVVPSFYTHICRYIHLTWDELKYKAKVKQNNIYSYWSDVGSSDGDRDLLRYGHNFLLLVQCHPFQGALLVANPNDEFFPPSAGLTAPMDLGVCLLLTFDTCTAEY